MSRYRIVTDAYSGYEVQRKLWWWPFWRQVSHGGGDCNTWPSVAAAEAFARGHMARVVKEVVASYPSRAGS